MIAIKLLSTIPFITLSLSLAELKSLDVLNVLEVKLK